MIYYFIIIYYYLLFYFIIILLIWLQYLGSTLVRNLRGTESTKRSIQKLKKKYAEPASCNPSTCMILAISLSGVHFVEASSQVGGPICLNMPTGSHRDRTNKSQSIRWLNSDVLLIAFRCKNRRPFANTRSAIFTALVRMPMIWPISPTSPRITLRRIITVTCFAYPRW